MDVPGRVALTLDTYRAEADRFTAALYEEEYLHYAGLKPELALQPIYERHADLTSLEACQELAAAADGSGRAAGELWRFACEGHLGNVTREQAEEVARLEASLTADLDGESVPFRMLRPLLANESDRSRRELIERARNELTERHLNAHLVAAREHVQTTVPRLGAETYRDLYAHFGFPLGELAESCARFLADTESLYDEMFDDLLRRRVGVSLADARRFDLPRVFRAPEWDAGFVADGMLPALEQTLAGLGIDLRSQANVHVDTEPRPTKSPRAFCAPIEVPGRVMLVIHPIGGADDWRALFHEAGHAEHFAHTSPALPFEAQQLGDDAVTEGWAFLLEHLVTDPAWLTRRLDFGRPGDFAAEAASILLYMGRRYAGKLLYELELHGGADLDAMPERYVERMLEATRIEFAREDFLADVDPGFYVTSYLRAWAFEARISAFLREQYGSAWFGLAKAGSLLRELWNEGQRMSADELLREVAGAELELGSLADRARELRQQ